MKFSTTLVLATALAASTSAYADNFVVQPVQAGYEHIRYQQGRPTIDLRMALGAVEIRPLALDHGSLAFSVAVLNASNAPATIDISNFSIKAGKQMLVPFSVDELQSKAKSRATWSKIGVSLVGGLAAGIAASQRDNYYGSISTPYETTTSHFSAPSFAGQMEGYRLADQTGAAIVAIQDRLDETRSRLGNDIVQTSTIDPGYTYAGKLVFQKLKDNSLPQRITLVVELNGEEYAFTFQLVKPGTPPPQIVYSSPQASSKGPTPAAQASAVSGAAPALVTAAYRPPAGSAMISLPPQSSNSAAAGNQSNWIPHEPASADIVRIIQRTAQLMPHPFTLKDGTIASSFAASGTSLILTAHVSAGTRKLDDEGKSALADAICHARALYPIIAQGGTVIARIASSGDQPVAILTLGRQDCGY